MNRRTLLRGLASTLALPSLEVFAAKSKAASPVRLGYVYAPNGVNGALWKPEIAGSLGMKLPKSLSALSDHASEIQVLRNLDLDGAKAQGDGAGDHARANAAFLTGCHPRKTAGADIQIGISADQVAANAVGNATRLPSLELSTDAARRSGKCDSGYSCAYQYNLAWSSATTPLPPERDPRHVFENLFGSGDQKQDASRRHLRKSVLDFAMDDARRLQKRASGNDRAKLDEYYTAVREVERRIERAEKFRIATPEIDKPNGVPAAYQEHIRAMYELMALAFQTDSTRISSFILAHDGSNRAFPEIGVPEGHHHMSHHNRKEHNLAQVAKIDAFYIEQFSWFLEKMRSLDDGNGQCVLDNSMIVYGAGINDGDRHSHDDVPVILAGRGGGQLSPGQTRFAQKGTPLSNLHLSLVNKMGAKADRIGDSTGELGIIG